MTDSRLRSGPRAAVLVALSLSGIAPAFAQPETMATRVKDTAARIDVGVVHADRPTQLTVTVGREGLPIVKAILFQEDLTPEVHLSALLGRVHANPRDPAAARKTTAALYLQSLGSDPVASADLPYLTVALDLGDDELEVDGLAPGIPGARSAAFAALDDPLPHLLAARDYRLDGASERVLAAIQETLRGSFVLAGAPCDAVAVVYTLFPGSYVAEVEPRCAGAGGSQGRLVFEIDQVMFSSAGTPRRAKVARIPEESVPLAAGISGEILFVPRLRADQVYSRSSPGFLAYGAADTGTRNLDFGSLHSGIGEALPCVPSATTLCLDRVAGDRRFEVTMSWHTAQDGGKSGTAFATPLSSLGIATGGLLSFFANNPEVLVKVLDGCLITGHFWIFGAPTTTLGYELRIVDTVARMDPELTSDDWLYVVTNVDGTTAPSFNDTSAFATCDVP